MRLLARFASDRSATSTLMFGLVSLPLLGVAGAVSDYAIAADARTKLQAVVDATALKLARSAATLEQAALQTQGDALVRALMGDRAELSVTGVTVTKGDKRLTVVAQGTVAARFGAVYGQTETSIASSAQVAWGVKKLEVALVLDNTGSMSSSGKMAALKTAVTNFINTMETVATEPGTVKISLVPFDTMVRIGTAHAAATWLTMSTMSSWQQEHWNGCVYDRTQPYDVSDDPAMPGVADTLYPARVCANSSLVEMMPLTEDYAALRTRAGEMQPSGYTNVTIGIAWGLATLSPEDPMGGGVAFGTVNVDKVMIVLTDGDNTQNRWTNSQSSIDARTALACSAVKAKAVKLYTVRVINGDATLLRNCATETSMYYDVQNADQLEPAFREIASSIQNVRLTQ